MPSKSTHIYSTCMHAYIHTHTYAHTFSHVCIHTYCTYIRTYIHTFINTRGSKSPTRVFSFPPSMEQAIASGLPNLRTLQWAVYQLCNLLSMPAVVPDRVRKLIQRKGFPVKIICFSTLRSYSLYVLLITINFSNPISSKIKNYFLAC